VGLPGTVKIALHLAGRIGKSKHRSNRFAYPLRIAFQIAGRIGSTAGSPNPAGGLFDFRKCAWMGGVCDIFNSGC
jgi:hypothetical protein